VNEEKINQKKNPINYISILFWVFAALMVAIMVFVTIQFFEPLRSRNVTVVESASSEETPTDSTIYLPDLTLEEDRTISRLANAITIIPTRDRTEVIYYTIESGDSVFGIAQQYNIEPETILWANKDILNDDPHMISVGMELRIPPVDGVYYLWKEGDTLEKVANDLKVEQKDILNWTPNKIDRANPVIEADTYVMVPGGQRELQQWVVPTIPRGAAGVSTGISGACDTSGNSTYGTGTFVWPSANHFISGNDYWSGHLAIDIGAMTGDAIFASDSGVVVYAGGISGGYGNMVMIDHGNGYQTLYAHLSAINVRCGQSVYQGQMIGAAGSTGNSTGPHLHFEVRYFSGFINPHYVLP